MATVCTTNDFETDEDGRLQVQICGDPVDAPPTACDLNDLQRDEECGLYVQKRFYDFYAQGASQGPSGPAGSGQGRVVTPAQMAATRNTGQGRVWTRNGDGTITINCDGIYQGSISSICTGSTGRIVGGQARIFTNTPLTPAVPGNILASQDWREVGTPSFDLAGQNDGPEFSAAFTRFLTAGTIINYRGITYTRAAGEQLVMTVVFGLVHLGRAV